MSKFNEGGGMSGDHINSLVANRIAPGPGISGKGMVFF